MGDLIQVASAASKKPKTPSDKDRIMELEIQQGDYNEHLARLYARTDDLNARLKVFEAHMNDLKAQAEAQLNGLDARVAELERPDVDDDAK